MCGGACEENWFDNLVESVGDGCRTSFWRDNWFQGQCWAFKYPNVFTNSEQKENNINNMGECRKSDWRWDLKWRRRWFLREEGQVQSFMQDSEIVTVFADRKDRWVWTLDTSGAFTVKYAYWGRYEWKFLGQRKEEYKLLRELKIPAKPRHFVWRMLNGGLPTKSALTRRGIDLQEVEKRCIFCNSGMDTIEHLFSIVKGSELFETVYTSGPILLHHCYKNRLCTSFNIWELE